MRLFLTTPETIFKVGKSAKVKLVFENLTGKTIPRVDLLAVVVYLKRKMSDEVRPGWDSDYLAFFEPKDKTELLNKSRYETEIDLSDLYWKDMMSSYRDKLEPKNFFQEIASGNFYLRAELVHSLDLWKNNDKRFKKSIESEKCLVTIESERQYKNEPRISQKKS